VAAGAGHPGEGGGGWGGGMSPIGTIRARDPHGFALRPARSLPDSASVITVIIIKKKLISNHA